MQAGRDVQKLRRQRRSRVLHPPFAILVSVKLLNRPMCLQSHRSRRQQNRIELFGPLRGIRFDGDVQGRLKTISGCDRQRHLFAIGFAPACREPGGRSISSARARGEEFLAPADEIARDAVDQRRIGRALGIEPRHAHSEIDRGMIGNVEKEDLRGRDRQIHSSCGAVRGKPSSRSAARRSGLCRAGAALR